MINNPPSDTLKVVRVDRRKWKNGYRGMGSSLLLNAEGFMCCLGFAAKRLGYSDEEILDQGAPYVLSPGYMGRTEGVRELPEEFQALVSKYNPSSSQPYYDNSGLCGSLMRTNDETETYCGQVTEESIRKIEEAREQKIHDEGVKAGLYFIFIN